MTSEKAPTVSSLPSGEPVPSRPTNTSLLLSAPTRADALLSHIHRCVQTRAGTDVVLLWLTYASRLSANLIEHVALPKAASTGLLKVALSLSAIAFRPGSATAALALQLAARLRALSAVLGEIRIFNRLWGLLGLYFAAKGAVAKARAAKAEGAAESTDVTFDTVLSYAQLTALVSYQAAENAAYLSSKKILGFSPQMQAKLGKWSVRSWGLYIGMELAKLMIERSRRVPLKAYTAEKVEEEKKWRVNWSTEFLRTLAWAPLTVNWSVNEQFLSDTTISALAFYPSMGMMKDLWRSTA